MLSELLLFNPSRWYWNHSQQILHLQVMWLLRAIWHLPSRCIFMACNVLLCMELKQSIIWVCHHVCMENVYSAIWLPVFLYRIDGRNSNINRKISVFNFKYLLPNNSIQGLMMFIANFVEFLLKYFEQHISKHHWRGWISRSISSSIRIYASNNYKAYPSPWKFVLNVLS